MIYRIEEENWLPKLEELDPLKVVRNIPQIFIVLSKSPLETEVSQQPSKLMEFLDCDPQSEKSVKSRHRRKPRPVSKEAEELGLVQEKKRKNRKNLQKQKDQSKNQKEAQKNKGENQKPKPEEKVENNNEK